MLYAIAVLCIILVGLAVLLNIASLPGNWLAIILLALWGWLAPDGHITVLYIVIVAAVAAAGEALEFILQMRGAKKYGSSSKGTWAGLLGAFVGALVGAPFLFGLGAFPGALIGAYVGSLLIELLCRRPFSEAKRAAWGAMTGKFSGMILKLTIGIAIFITGAQRVWP